MTKTIFLSFKKKKKKKVKGTLDWIAPKLIHRNTDNNRTNNNTLHTEQQLRQQREQTTDNNRTNNNTLHTEQQLRQQREQTTAGRAYLLASHIVQWEKKKKKKKIIRLSSSTVFTNILTNFIDIYKQLKLE